MEADEQIRFLVGAILLWSEDTRAQYRLPQDLRCGHASAALFFRVVVITSNHGRGLNVETSLQVVLCGIRMWIRYPSSGGAYVGSGSAAAGSGCSAYYITMSTAIFYSPWKSWKVLCPIQSFIASSGRCVATRMRYRGYCLLDPKGRGKPF